MSFWAELAASVVDGLGRLIFFFRDRPVGRREKEPDNGLDKVNKQYSTLRRRNKQHDGDDELSDGTKS
jgi:hypothetical protein